MNAYTRDILMGAGSSVLSGTGIGLIAGIFGMSNPILWGLMMFALQGAYKAGMIQERHKRK